MILVVPAEPYLAGYADALRRGWSPNNERGAAEAREHLERIAADPTKFLRSLVDREGAGGAITLPDGTSVPRLPGYVKWMWDGEFCGSIGLRWQPGTSKLPEYCLGHVGYSVVLWKRGRGYATQALRELLSDARDVGLDYLELTADPENVASQRVIEANGGALVERFKKPAAYGNAESLRYRIPLESRVFAGKPRATPD
jgi:predicted acetyltransferase